MIDGGSEKLEQEFIGYLLSRNSTTPAELADHFHLSDRSAAYWLGCLVKSGRLRITRWRRTPWLLEKPCGSEKNPIGPR